MQTLLEIGLSNAIWAAVLALLGGASRLVRRPALTHSLWVRVLLKLITPPLFTIPNTWSPLETATIEQSQPERQAEVTTLADQEVGATMSLPILPLSSSAESSMSAKDESQHSQPATQTLHARPTSQTEDESAFSLATRSSMR